MARLASVMCLLGVLLGAIGMDGQASSKADAQETTPPAPAVPASRQADNVAIITIRGPIDKYTEKSVTRRLKLAEDAGADAVVIDLDTPGGEVGAVLAICNALKGSSIANTIAWVNPNAYSGGAIIALACRTIITNEPATMGDALPIFLTMGVLRQMGDEEREKILAPLLAEVTDSARRYGWGEKLVQGMVSLGVELWLVENKETGQRLFIDRPEYLMLFGPPPPTETAVIGSGAALGAQTEQAPPPFPEGPQGESAQDDPLRFHPGAPALRDEQMVRSVTAAQELPSDRPVLSEADRGKWVKIAYVSSGQGPIILKADQMVRFGLASAVIHSDGELKAWLGAKNMTRLDRSWSETLVRWLTQTWVRGVLIAVFLVGLFLELSAPGITVPGMIAAGAMALFIVPPMLTGLAGWWEVAAMGTGVVLIMLELLVIPGFGIPGVAGAILLLLGMVGTFVPDAAGLFPTSPARQNDMLYGVATVLLACFTAGIAMYYFGKHMRSLPVFGRLILTDEPSGERAVDSLYAAMEETAPPSLAIGAEGLTTTPLYPVGRAQFGDTVVEVSSSLGYIDKGRAVRIVRAGDLGGWIVEPTDDVDAQRAKDSGT